jgi:hypothetical protein
VRAEAASAAEQLEAQRQQGSAIPVGEETAVADAHESWRQHMEQEAAQELVGVQSHGPLLPKGHPLAEEPSTVSALASSRILLYSREGAPEVFDAYDA